MLTKFERETIVNFNQGEDTASIFTYEKTWRSHLERKLGLKAVMDNGHGGKLYELPKRLIPMPRTKQRQYSEESKRKMAMRLTVLRGRQKALLSPKSL